MRQKAQSCRSSWLACISSLVRGGTLIGCRLDLQSSPEDDEEGHWLEAWAGLAYGVVTVYAGSHLGT